MEWKIIEQTEFPNGPYAGQFVTVWSDGKDIAIQDARLTELHSKGKYPTTGARWETTVWAWEQIKEIWRKPSQIEVVG